MVDGLAESSEERFVGGGEVAADDDDLGVEQRNGSGQDAADAPPGVTDHAEGFGVAFQGDGDDVAYIAHVAAELLQRPDDGPAACDRLEAVGLSAAAQHASADADRDMAELAGRGQ